MLKCNSCGKEIYEDELDYTYERYPYGDTYVLKRLILNTCGCGGEYEAAIMCDVCKEWNLEDDIFGYENCVCKNCIEANFDLAMIKEISEAEGSRTAIKINSLLSYVYSQEEVENILWGNLHKIIEGKRFHSSRQDEVIDSIYKWKNADISAVADAIHVIYNQKEKSMKERCNYGANSEIFEQTADISSSDT